VSPRLPLCSSRQIVAALKRLGFVPGPAKSSSHQSFCRRRGDKTDITVVVLGEREVPRPTLVGILKLANVSRAEFLKHLK